MHKKEKRDLFIELEQGLNEVQAYQEKKLTLRTHRVKKMPALKVDAKYIRDTRKMLNMSRNLFALKLRASARTVEKWEQNETLPNDQAAALIRLVREYPDTLDRLSKLK
jgi:putative transcriptional regulator